MIKLEVYTYQFFESDDFTQQVGREEQLNSEKRKRQRPFLESFFYFIIESMLFKEKSNPKIC
ncbi:hypothetical protein P5641_23115 [Bacillus subtilis]